MWIIFFHSTSCNAFVLGVQALRNPKTLNKIDSFSFKTISKNGNSHAIDEMNSSALNPVTHATSLFLLRNKDNSEIVTPSLLLPFNQDNPAITTATHAQNLLASSFDNKSSATLKLVVASVRNEDFKGQTNDSPAKQRPVT